MTLRLFIHCFRTYLYFYFYDFNTNAIVRVPENVYAYLREAERGTARECNDESVRKILSRLVNDGFLSEHRWSRIEHPATHMLQTYLDASVQSLTLQVTQQCNLKCEYCPYSGNYNNRTHADHAMPLGVAMRAADFYFMHSYDIPTAQIGFYGGEPLLEFDLIKDIVAYCRKECYGKEIRYFLTTNATLLTDEKLEFLMENDFVLTISLDGPRIYHNKNRHRMDDTGSYDTVMHNIENLHRKYPDKADNIQFNCVVDPEADLQCISDFFIQEDALKEYRVLFNAISRYGLKDEGKFVPGRTYTEQYEYEKFKMMYNAYGKVRGINVSGIVEAYYWQMKARYRDRTLTAGCEECSHPSGPCIPGAHKLFVDVKGNFYPCEKVCEESGDMVIGNIEEGFRVSQADYLLNIAKLTSDECRNCWCAKFCFICAAHLEDRGANGSDGYRKYCTRCKTSVENDLKDYCAICEGDGFEGVWEVL